MLRSPKGLSPAVVDLIAEQKNEPAWMRRIRYEGLRQFSQLPLPSFGPDLSRLDFDELYYYLKPSERKAQTWNDVPPEIQRTFNRLKLPQYEQEWLAGVGAQYDSENIYHSVLPGLREQGVLFTDVETAVRERPDLVKKYFGKLVDKRYVHVTEYILKKLRRFRGLYGRHGLYFCLDYFWVCRSG